MPGEDTPAPAGQADAPVAAFPSVSKVHSAIGTVGSVRVFQSMRQYDVVLVRPTAARKMSAPLLCAAALP